MPGGAADLNGGVRQVSVTSYGKYIEFDFIKNREMSFFA
jgi:hypothetical protein